jgi:peptidoglycan/xylan/chitin deacetylase (PgdA/CDA1 family)
VVLALVVLHIHARRHDMVSCLRQLGPLFLAALLAGCGGNVPVLMYHSVGSGTDPLGVSEAELDAHLGYLQQAGFQTISLSEMLDHMEGHGAMPANPIVLTFDDGTADAIGRALPLLKKRGQRATFFIVAGFTAPDGAPRHVEQSRQGPQSYLTWPEVRALRDAGMEIGSHSVSHPRLSSLPKAQVRSEIVDSKNMLERGLGQPVAFFAYPFTACRKDTAAQVRAAGYRGAVSGLKGSNDPNDLQRLVVHRGLSADQLKALLSTDWASSYTTGK